MADAANDRAGPDPEGAPGTLEPKDDRIHRRFHGEFPARMERGAVANFHVPDLLRVRILGQLEGGSLEGLRFLEHLEREIEGFEILRETDAGGQASQEAAEVRRARDPGQSDALLSGEVEERRRTERSVEVDVKVGLGKRVEECPATPGITPRRRSPSPWRVAHPDPPQPCT